MVSGKTAEAKSVTPAESRESLGRRFEATRKFTEQLCAPLSKEDCTVQSMRDVSPTRWHLAHTSWFFETFCLAPSPRYRSFHPGFEYLFNSYYNTVGQQFPRHQRGLLSRPGLDEIWQYRRHVDRHVMESLAESDDVALQRVVELGIHHEQQHQELILTDIKHVLSCNPLFPCYGAAPAARRVGTGPAAWMSFERGIYEIGHNGQGFAYDNETPRHQRLVEGFEIMDRPVNCGEYLEFMADGGYARPELWLSAGWEALSNALWQSPLYWHFREGRWWQFTLAGLREVDPSESVCHVSYFEADAFARWRGARLPTEDAWEIASGEARVEGNFADSGRAGDVAPHPAAPPASADGTLHMFGDVWQWTASPYTPYPGYQPQEGALGEYNGKFMCNQYVLRGGSCATPKSHIRHTYRNFFPPEARWQFTGFRLVR